MMDVKTDFEKALEEILFKSAMAGHQGVKEVVLDNQDLTELLAYIQDRLKEREDVNSIK